jgi:hypothetical protein
MVTLQEGFSFKSVRKTPNQTFSKNNYDVLFTKEKHFKLSPEFMGKIDAANKGFAIIENEQNDGKVYLAVIPNEIAEFFKGKANSPVKGDSFTSNKLGKHFIGLGLQEGNLFLDLVPGTEDVQIEFAPDGSKVPAYTAPVYEVSNTKEEQTVADDSTNAVEVLADEID